MVKRYFYQGLKMVGVLFLVIVMFFSGVSNTYAQLISIDEFVNEFKTSFIDELDISLVVNKENKTLNIYGDSEEPFSFNYTDEYIEYDNRDSEVLDDTVSELDFATIMVFMGILNTMLNLSGYKDMLADIQDNEDFEGNADFLDNIDFANAYDTYGIQIESEHYEFSGEDENGSWSSSGEHIKYFKVSLDTTKMDALVEGFTSSGQDEISNLVPTLRADDITENSVTLYPSITDFDSNLDVNCYVYRATKEDGEYEKISDWAVNCLDGVGVIDSELQSDTTYYYKAIVDGGIKYSDILEVTTKGVLSNSSNNDNYLDNNRSDGIENPQTGTFFQLYLF